MPDPECPLHPSHPLVPTGPWLSVCGGEKHQVAPESNNPSVPLGGGSCTLSLRVLICGGRKQPQCAGRLGGEGVRRASSGPGTEEVPVTPSECFRKIILTTALGTRHRRCGYGTIPIFQKLRPSPLLTLFIIN